MIKELRREFTGSPLEMSAEQWFWKSRNMTLGIWPDGSVEEHVKLVLIGAPPKVVREVYFHEQPTLTTIKETLEFYYPHSLFADTESDAEVFLIASRAFDTLGHDTSSALKVYKALAAHFFSLLTKKGLCVDSLDTNFLKFKTDVDTLKALVKTACDRERTAKLLRNPSQAADQANKTRKGGPKAAAVETA
ncbi:hypothetical protein GGF42_001534 [Coemansia sp. RSA 2424]|nr:hypothetical protein GGF42_001534 [Coemansia sp. RSA 2424]